MSEELGTIELKAPWAAMVPGMIRLIINDPEDATKSGLAHRELIRLAGNMDAIIADLPGLAEALGKLEGELPRLPSHDHLWDTVQNFVDKYGKKEPTQ